MALPAGPIFWDGITFPAYAGTPVLLDEARFPACCCVELFRYEPCDHSLSVEYHRYVACAHDIDPPPSRTYVPPP